GRVGRLRDGALRRADRGDDGNIGPARHFRRSDGRKHAAGERAEREAAGRWVVRRCAPTALVRSHRDANGRREIDIARVQMLYFTLVTAAFVVMRVLTSYVIPEIPQGFQILMGISNAVYFGSKVAQPPASTAANTAAANDDAPPPMPPAQS